MRALIKKILLEETKFLNSDEGIVRAINHLIKDGEYEGSWKLSDDEIANFYIQYEVGWPVLWQENNKIVGIVYIDVTKLVYGSAVDDFWLTADDMERIPDNVWDDLRVEILKKIKNFLPNNMDVKVEFIY